MGQLLLKGLAKFFRFAFNPLFIPTYLFAVLVFNSSLMAHYPPAIKWKIIEIIAISTIGTILWSYVPYKITGRLLRSKNSDVTIESSTTYKRFLVYFVMFSSYILAISLLSKFLTLSLCLRIFLAPILFILFQILVSRFKINISSWSGAFGVLSTTLYLFIVYGTNDLFTPLICSILIGGGVATSQIYLKKESLFDSFTGCLFGITSTLLAFVIGGFF